MLISFFIQRFRHKTLNDASFLVATITKAEASQGVMRILRKRNLLVDERCMLLLTFQKSFHVSLAFSSCCLESFHHSSRLEQNFLLIIYEQHIFIHFNSAKFRANLLGRNRLCLKFFKIFKRTRKSSQVIRKMF